MNRLKFFLSLVFVFVFLALGSFTVLADEDAEPWNSKVKHISDHCDVLSEEADRAENSLVKEEIIASQFDYSAIIISSEKYEGFEFYDYFDRLYKQNNLGYGENHDGLYLGIDGNKNIFTIRMYGRANVIFAREDIDDLIAKIQNAYMNEGYAGAIHAFHSQAYEKVIASGTIAEPQKNYEAPSFDTLTVPLDTIERGTAPIINGILMPSWYEAEPDKFVDFHNDESVSRLIDNADILTTEEEEKIEKHLDQIRSITNQDIVILTDNTSYGLDNELYEMDFYVYNGYGCGDDFDGIMLFINMDPDNREMVSTAFGKARTPFTEKNSSLLDDILYDHLVEAEYADAFLDWSEGVENLLLYNKVNFPVWYKAYIRGGIPEKANEKKIVNDLGGISEEDKKELLKTIRKLRELYNTDVIVYISDIAYDLSTDGDELDDKEKVYQYLDLFYEAHGYGIGEDKSGILLGILTEENSMYVCTVRTYGSISDKFTPKIKDRLENISLLNLSQGNYNYNVNRYLYYLGKLLKTGRLPHTWPIRIFWTILCSIIGYVFGAIGMSMKPKKAIYAKIADSADDLLVKDSLRIIYKNDKLTHTTVETEYIGYDDDSGSSRSYSSSSRPSSSYSSHSSSSSGRSGSTSRRKF